MVKIMKRLPRRLRAGKYMLFTLNSASPKLRKLIIQHCDSEFVKTLSEISLNTLHGNLPVDAKTKALLVKYKTCLRKLASKTTSVKKKRSMLVQRGGALIPTLLSILLSSVVGPLLQN